MQAKKLPKSLFYNPSMNNAVTHFRHQALLDYIAEENKKSNKPAQFYLVTDGVTAGGDSYGIDGSLAPWHIEHSLNFLEANGKIRLFTLTGPYSGDIAAVVSELVTAIMPPENQPVPATKPPQNHLSTDTKQ